MGVIKKLAQALISQIAAGEVIERPASVIRELMDNAIDAGAERIDVDIGRGGITYIHIQDDGKGIGADDLPLAVERHATSKISSFEELTQVQTLGFRGEALASMGSVGNLTIRSRAAGAPMAYSIRVSAGVQEPVKVDPKFAQGTSIRLEHLFLHVPARRKFLKSENHELQKCKEAFIRSALSHPQVHMTFKKDGKLVYDFKKINALQRVKDVFGAPWDADIQTVSHVHALQEGTVRVEGFVSSAKSVGSHKEMEFLFVNGRFVKDKTIAHALKEAFLQCKGIKDGAYALWLYMPFDFVDANAHPAKVEVRFKDVRVLHQLVYQGVVDALGGVAKSGAKIQTPGWSYPQQVQAQKQLNWFVEQQGAEKEEDLFSSDKSTSLANAPIQSDALQVYGYRTVVQENGICIVPNSGLKRLQLLYEFNDAVQNGAVKSARFLVPFSMTISSQQKIIVQRHGRLLQALGIECRVELDTLWIDAFPEPFVQADLLSALVGVLEQLTKSDTALDVCTHLVLALPSESRVWDNVPLNDRMLVQGTFAVWMAHHCADFGGWFAKKLDN